MCSELPGRLGSGPGQWNLLSEEPVGEQRLDGDRGNITLVDRRVLRGAVGCADHVPAAQLRRPEAEEVRRVLVRPQAHPLQAAGDHGLLELGVEVAAPARGLPGVVFVDVGGGKRDGPDDAGALRESQDLRGGGLDGAGVEEDRGDAVKASM